jgi:hypothetical protein
MQTSTIHRQREHEFFSGWKEIACYLGKGVRTVQRYERYFGLPVRRPAGKPWGSVIATKAELDAWMIAAPIREALPIAKPVQAVSLDHLQQQITQMLALRKQMEGLRNDVRVGVRLLHETVHRLQTGLNANQYCDPDSPSPQLFDVSDFKTGKRKAS